MANIKNQTGYYLSYNKVELELTSGSKISREHIYSEDDTTYLYTRWTFDGNFLYNPMVNSFDDLENRTPGVLPTNSDVNIRDALRSQRRQLVYGIPSPDPLLGIDVLLETPAEGFVTDAYNGPRVLRCNIIQTHGVKTFICDIMIVAHVNECGEDDDGNRNVLLSHRWKRTETVDEDYFSTIITEGQAIFRSDFLMDSAFPPGNPNNLPWPTFPDQFRKDLFHPIPNMFKRDAIEVSPDPDGVTYNYRVVDKQKAVRGPAYQLPGQGSPVSPGGVTRIEAYHTSFYSHESIFRTMDPFASTSQYKNHVIARVWGNGLFARMSLQKFAIGVVLGTINEGARGTSSEFFISHCLSGSFVQCELTTSEGFGRRLLDIANGIFSGQGTPPTGMEKVTSSFNRVWRNNQTISLTENIQGYGRVVHYPIIGQAANGTNGQLPAPPGDGKSRGGWIGNLVAQALSGRCRIPPSPPKVTTINSNVQTYSGGYNTLPSANSLNPPLDRVRVINLY